MYANLRIELTTGDVVHAWKITPGGRRALTLHLDANDGESDHTAPAGTRTISLDEVGLIRAEF